jgi:hypothetical protein
MGTFQSKLNDGDSEKQDIRPKGEAEKGGV